MFATGLLDDAELAVVAVDRAKGKVFEQRYTTDVCPTLTTNNKWLWVISLNDMSLPDEDRAFFRLLDSRERFILQGFPHEVASKLPTEVCRVKAAGNAYPVPLLIANLHGMIKTITESNIDIVAWPSNLPTPPPMPEPSPIKKRPASIAMPEPKNKPKPAKKIRTTIWVES